MSPPYVIRASRFSFFFSGSFFSCNQSVRPVSFEYLLLQLMHIVNLLPLFYFQFISPPFFFKSTTTDTTFLSHLACRLNRHCPRSTTRAVVRGNDERRVMIRKGRRVPANRDTRPLTNSFSSSPSLVFFPQIDSPSSR